MALNSEKPHPIGKLLPASLYEGADWTLYRPLQNHRYHESLNNLTPTDVYFGRNQSILEQRERIKRQTINERRLQHRKKAA